MNLTHFIQGQKRLAVLNALHKLFNSFHRTGSFQLSIRQQKIVHLKKTVFPIVFDKVCCEKLKKDV